MRMWSSSIPPLLRFLPQGEGRFGSVDSHYWVRHFTGGEALELGLMGSMRSCERMRTKSATIASMRTKSAAIASSGGGLRRREVTLISPPSLCYGPSKVSFLKEIYDRSKEADKFLMSLQFALKHSWNTSTKLMHSWGSLKGGGVRRKQRRDL